MSHPEVFTFLQYCFAEYEQRTLYGALVVTLAMLLRLINRRFIIIIIIKNTGMHLLLHMPKINKLQYIYIHRIP